MSFGKPKSKGTARSDASVEHGPGDGERQRKEQIDQREGRIDAIERELAELSPQRIAARRAVLQIKKESAEQLRDAERTMQELNLGFNFHIDGTHVSDIEDKRLVRQAEKVQCYWKPYGAHRIGAWKSVPLGGNLDGLGQSTACPVWYFASNLPPWHTWALIDGTRAGLNGQAFLTIIMVRHTQWVIDFTKHRLVIGQCHQKPNNIHNQSWLSAISEPSPNPSQPTAKIDPSRLTGALLGRDDMKGRGRSPMRFVFLGKTGCSLANLRRANFDINKLTGDPEMSVKLDRWINRRMRNGGQPLDMLSEFKLQDIVEDAVSEFPEWKSFFAAATSRHKEQKEKEIVRIHEEISREVALIDNRDLRARLEAEEKKNAEIREGAQLIQDNSRTLQAENRELVTQLAKKTKEVEVVNTVEVAPSRQTQDKERAAIISKTKAESRLQYELFRELGTLVTALEMSNRSSKQLPLLPSWAPYYYQVSPGKHGVTDKFFELLDRLPEFHAEAEELRTRARRLLPEINFIQAREFSEPVKNNPNIGDIKTKEKTHER